MTATIGLSGGSFRGLLLDNEANADRQGSGFTPLCHLSYPGQNLYRDDAVGLNFEHIMNGRGGRRRPLDVHSPERPLLPPLSCSW